MCGIVGAAARRDIVPVLIEGLKRLEYRGYDSCGVAALASDRLERLRSVARVSDLSLQIEKKRLTAQTGIAHTRWATHGAPVTRNAHPILSRGEIALVHNGIIENHDELRDELKGKCYAFETQTDTEVRAFSMLEDAEIGAGCRVGPYARLRPGARLAEGVHIGNFVEVKASRIGAGSKANHLAYIGDAEVGRKVNIGAGTITCNYDGAAKNRTVIEDDCFIGSDATLVAPVRIARGSYIGAGSTISKDTPPGQLTVARAKQVSIPGWTPPRKKPAGAN